MTRDTLVRRDAEAVVQRAFAGREVFSCLSGSTVTSEASSSSDIDIVVVLPDDMPAHEVVGGRAAFTRGYLALHDRHGRPPDRLWPGEVLYLRDLEAALLGAAFDLDDPDHRLAAGPLDGSHRYWTSMIACSVPLTRTPASAEASGRCARILAAQALTRHAYSDEGAAAKPGESLGEAVSTSLRSDWGIRLSPFAATAALNSEIRRLARAVRCEGTVTLDTWRRGLRPAQRTPWLDGFCEQWRDLVAGHLRDRSDSPGAA